MTKHYEKDANTFAADAYRVHGYNGVAWHVYGWETIPTEETEWSGLEDRTGNVVCVMIGDDTHFTFSPEDITPLDREDYCGQCGQIGCLHDGYVRE